MADFGPFQLSAQKATAYVPAPTPGADSQSHELEAARPQLWGSGRGSRTLFSKTWGSMFSWEIASSQLRPKDTASQPLS